MAINTIKFFDPSDNIVEYIKEVKPYHTKLGEVNVEYFYKDRIKVTVTDDHHLQIDIVRPAHAPNLGCEQSGYGTREYGDLPRIPVISPNQQISNADYPAVNLTNNTLTLPGNFTNLFCGQTPVSLISYVEDHDYVTGVINIEKIVQVTGCYRSIYDISVYDACRYDDGGGVQGYPIVATLANAFVVADNAFYGETDFTDVTIRVIGSQSGTNDKRYSVTSATYNSGTGQTTIYVDKPVTTGLTPQGYLQTPYYSISNIVGAKLILDGNYSTVFEAGDQIILFDTAGGQTECQPSENEINARITAVTTQGGITSLEIESSLELFSTTTTFPIINYNLSENYFTVEGNVSQHFPKSQPVGVAAADGSNVYYVRTVQIVGGDTRIFVYGIIDPSTTPDATITSVPSTYQIITARSVNEPEEVKNSFEILGNRAAFFSPMTPFFVGSTTGNNGFYTVSHRGAYYDNDNDVTIIPVNQNIVDPADEGIIYTNKQFDIGRYDRLALQRRGTTLCYRKPWELFGQYTVVDAVYDRGFVDSWPDASDPSTYTLGNDPHTIVQIQQPLVALPADTDNLHYSVYIVPGGIPITRVVSYSNSYRYYDVNTQEYISVPDEGYVTKDIVGIELTTPVPGSGKFIVPGDLTRSNIFVGDKFIVGETRFNNGTYTIYSLQYDYSTDTTAIGVEQLITNDDIEGYVRIDTVSNALFVSGDQTCCFRQGKTFNVLNGTIAGHYNVVYSDYINGETRIRVRENIFTTYQPEGTVIIDVVANGFVVNSDVSAQYPIGQQFNVVGSPSNDGYYLTSSTTYDSVTNTTTIFVEQAVDQIARGALHRFDSGLIMYDRKGYSESPDVCNIVDEGLVRVASTMISEDLSFGWGTTYTWEIVSVDQGTNTVCVDGDYSSIIDPSDRAYITGSTANNGQYVIGSVNYDDLLVRTCVTFSTPALPSDVVGGSLKIEDVDISQWYQFIIVYADAGDDYFVLQGNATKVIQVGHIIKVVGSPSNDGIYTIGQTPIYDLISKTTVVYVNESVNNTERGGWVEPLRYFQHLAQLVLRDRISAHVIDEVVDIAPTTGGMVVDGWDMPMWDLGAWDESLQQNLHVYGQAFSYQNDERMIK